MRKYDWSAPRASENKSPRRRGGCAVRERKLSPFPSFFPVYRVFVYFFFITNSIFRYQEDARKIPDLTIRYRYSVSRSLPEEVSRFFFLLHNRGFAWALLVRYAIIPGIIFSSLLRFFKSFWLFFSFRRLLINVFTQIIGSDECSRVSFGWLIIVMKVYRVVFPVLVPIIVTFYYDFFFFESLG